MKIFRSSVITHGLSSLVKYISQKISASPAEISFMWIDWVEKLMESIKPLQAPWITSGFENEQVFA